MDGRAPSKRTLLITGVSGYVGSAVAPLAVAAGHRVTGTYFHHPPTPALASCELVQTPIEQIPALIRDLRPAVVLHTAAAWRTEAEARGVIVEGTRGIANAVAESGAAFIHMSTDLVFDGEHGPYSEDSQPAPVNFYGAAKAEAERIVAEAFGLGRPSTPLHAAQDGPSTALHSAQDGPSTALHSAQDAPATRGAVIVRTSLVTCFDPPDPRTQPIVDALAGRRAPVTLFTDEHRCPVRVEDLAAALVELIDRVDSVDGPFTGLLHIAGPERLSRYELGLRIARFYGRDPAPGIIPGLARDSGQPRPRDCTLSIALAQRTLHTILRPLP